MSGLVAVTQGGDLLLNSAPGRRWTDAAARLVIVYSSAREAHHAPAHTAEPGVC